MCHRTGSACGFFSRVLLLLAAFFLYPLEGRAQQLAFNPGMASLVAGDPTGEKIPSPHNFTGQAKDFVLSYFTKLGAADKYGNIYISESGVVRVIASGRGPIPALPSAGANPAAGSVYTLAGNKLPPPKTGPSPCAAPGGNPEGDGCPAPQAYVGSPTVAVDRQGNVYVLDYANLKVALRVIYSGGAVPNLPAGAVPGSIYRMAVNEGSGPLGSPTNAGFRYANYISADPNGNVYLANSQQVFALYAGGSVPGVSQPVKGNTYLVANSRGARCYPTTEPCGDGGTATLAGFQYVSSISTDLSGNVYIVDSSAYRIRAIYVAGNLPGISNPIAGNIYTIAGTGKGSDKVPGAEGVPATASTLGGVLSVTNDGVGNVYLSEFNGNSDPLGLQSRIRKIDPSGIIITIFGGTSTVCPASTDPFGDGCPSNLAKGTAQTMAADPGGDVYFVFAGTVPATGKSATLIRKSTVAQVTLPFSATVGFSSKQVVSVYNTSAQALQFNGIAIQDDLRNSAFSQFATGGSSDCGNFTSLKAGESCQIGIQFMSPTAANVSGSVTVTSNSTNATGGKNTITLSGTSTQATSTTELTVAPRISNVGQPVTFTARIVPQWQVRVLPTGTVTFSNGSTALGTGSISNYVATFTTSSLPVGTTTVTASYAGDANFVGSSSFPLTAQVSAVPVPTVTISASASNIKKGQSVTFTATVTPYSGTVTPTGTVTFQDGGASVGTATLNGSGVASFTTSALPPGKNTLYAVYNPAAYYASAVSTGVTVSIAADAELSITPGIISRVAGRYRVAKYAGDEGPAVDATFASPAGFAVDASGNVYVAEGWTYYGGGHVVRVIVAPTLTGPKTILGRSNLIPGNIYKVAGTPGNYAYPNPPPCPDQTQPCGDGGPATSALLNNPVALAVDAFGNLYIADRAKVRKVDAQTGIITTVAGTGVVGYSGDRGPAKSAQLSYQGGITVDNAGDIYISDGSRVRRVDALSGVITTVGGTGTPGYSGDGGPAVDAKLYQPKGLATDAAGNLYVVDSWKSVVRRIDAESGIITTVAGWELLGSGDNSGDGGLATAARLVRPNDVIADANGNLYIVSGELVRVVNAKTGIITTFAGSPRQYCSPTAVPCGDGGLATKASLSGPAGVKLDNRGNLYISDARESVIRKVTATTTSLDFGSLNLGRMATETLTLTNTGAQPLTFTGLSVTAPFLQDPSGATDCTSSITLAPGAACQISVTFFPLVGGAANGTVTIASNATNATNGQSSIALAGTGVGYGGATPQTITFRALPNVTYGIPPFSLGAHASSGLPITYRVAGPATVSTTGVGSTLTITGTGTVTLTAYQFGNAQYAEATRVSQSFTVAPAPLRVNAESVSRILGVPNPSLTYQVTGLAANDRLTGAPQLTTVATPSSPTGTYPINITQGTLAIPSNYSPTFINGMLTVTGTTNQTITFGPLANATYGAPAITLNATTSSGLPVSYSVTGPATVAGNLLTFTGAGAVAVTANQAGDATYRAATPVTQSLVVSPAVLTVTADNMRIAQGAPIPELTYTITGYVKSDSQAVVYGNPLLTTTATSASPLGSYPIRISRGTLGTANYTFNLVPGTLQVVSGKAQTITFAPLPNMSYGTAPFTLWATASSGLAVTYTASGPAAVSGSTLTITGAGTVAVTARQEGNADYAPAAPVKQSFTVTPAVLTVTAEDVTRVNNIPNPAFTKYTLSGFVRGETSDRVGGSPIMTTPATAGSAVGTYPIIIKQGTLAAANYTFGSFVNGTLTITPGGPAADFTLTASPAVLTMVAGQIRQTVITLSPQNYYQGLVTLSCGPLPTNVSCVFSPAALNVDGSGNPVSGTLTVNSNASAPIVGQLRPTSGASRLLAAAFYLPGGLMGLLIAFTRKRLTKNALPWHLLTFLVLFAGAMAMAACGSGSVKTDSSLAPPGTSTITVNAAGAGSVSHSLGLTITIR